MKKIRFTALLLSGVMAVSVFAGCGSVNKEAVVATFDEKEIALGVPNFAARLQQAYQDDMYQYYFGGSVWDNDFYGNGTTMAEDVKSSVMESMFELYTLQAHMEEYGVTLSEDEKASITEAATAFIEANSSKALKELGADQEIVEEYLTLLTIQAKMHEAIIADVDTNVSDEEANTGAYSYVTVSKTSYTDEDGNTAEYTEEELAELADTVKAFVAEAKDGSMEDAAENYAYTVNTGTFTANDEYLDENVLAALQGLEEGEISEVIDTENTYYVVRLDAKTDEAATETTRQNIIADREDALYDEVLTGWQEEHVWEVNESVWETVSFDKIFTTIEQSETTDDAETTEQ